MAYPIGPLLQALAERILANLDLIQSLAPKPGDPDQNRAPYSDTQLLISLLGVLVFPHERAPDALGELLKGYKPLPDAVRIVYPSPTELKNGVEITGADGERERVDPGSLKNLPRLLRNSIAHFNILPLERDGLFSGVRVWNKDDDGNITLVADLDFEEVRSLARHILKALAQPKRPLRLDDPQDPMQLLGRAPARTTRSKKPPRVTDTLWAKLVEACDGDAIKAKDELDKAVKEKADQILAKRR
ncbi:hypothetical protein FHR70_003499 [Microvirga lupini]|uniref:pEK499-p136 HEPN domain-containing protein n=1 Tax=Microvirga lupini TaxID=420324 RepID=A0A7W4VNG3_9HYPH|nr:HEPN family nuclease [Microvirga lupini]MBB3020418.1 hypothetical protein [Microvirga lupini]